MSLGNRRVLYMDFHHHQGPLHQDISYKLYQILNLVNLYYFLHLKELIQGRQQFYLVPKKSSLLLDLFEAINFQLPQVHFQSEQLFTISDWDLLPQLFVFLRQVLQLKSKETNHSMHYPIQFHFFLYILYSDNYYLSEN